MVECKNCGNTLKEAQEKYPETDNRHYFFETQFGDYSCEGDECVWAYVGEHTQVSSGNLS
jgi:hypothetical protein